MGFTNFTHTVIEVISEDTQDGTVSTEFGNDHSEVGFSINYQWDKELHLCWNLTDDSSNPALEAEVTVRITDGNGSVILEDNYHEGDHPVLYLGMKVNEDWLWEIIGRPTAVG